MANGLYFQEKVTFLSGLPITLPAAATDPARAGSASAGDMYYNTISNTIRFYNGTVWAAISGGSTGNFVFSGDSVTDAVGAPAYSATNPGSGMSWTTADVTGATVPGSFTWTAGNSVSVQAGGYTFHLGHATASAEGAFVVDDPGAGTTALTLGSTGQAVFGAGGGGSVRAASIGYGTGGGGHFYFTGTASIGVVGGLHDDGPFLYTIGGYGPANGENLYPFKAFAGNGILLGYSSGAAMPSFSPGTILVKTGNPLHLIADYIWLDGTSNTTYANVNIGALSTNNTGAILGVTIPASGYVGFTSDTNYPALLTFSSSGGPQTSPTATQSGDQLGQFLYFGWGTTVQLETANINVYATENWTDTAFGSAIQFTATANGGGPSTTWTMDQDGGFKGSGNPTPNNYFGLPEISTPATPPANNHDLYFKADGNLYTLNSSAVEAQVASTASQTFTGTVTAPVLDLTAAQTTLNGTTGTAVCSEPFQGSSYKKVVVYFSGYTETGSQVYTFPTAFTHTPYVYGLSTAVSATTITTTTATFVSVGALSGFLFIEGF